MLTFKVPHLKNQTLVTPYGGHSVTFDADGVGSAPDDCGLFDEQGVFLLGKPEQGELLDGSPAVRVQDGQITEQPQALARWKATKPYLHGSEIVTPNLGITARFDAEGECVAPYNCGFLGDDFPHVEFVAMVDGAEVPEHLLPTIPEPAATGAAPGAELDEESRLALMTDEEIEAELDRQEAVLATQRARLAQSRQSTEATPVQPGSGAPTPFDELMKLNRAQMEAEAVRYEVDPKKHGKKEDLAKAILASAGYSGAAVQPSTKSADEEAVEAALAQG